MTTARIALRLDPCAPPVRRRLFGSFVEHLGRGVYDGLYEPAHPRANSEGFREDVIDLVKELGVSTLRYPGGNFVSGYRWEDGVGPRDQRPVRLDLAWQMLETNQVGLDEFARFCALTGTELMLAVNLATRGITEALDLLEYANHPSGTTLSDQRIANGSPEPHGIRMWCLGNEMDGEWQIGFMEPEEYGRLAARTASAMKKIDPTLELVAVGSSYSGMPRFGEWERIVLEKAYDYVDFISCHSYYQEKDGDLGSFLASSTDMDHFIDTVAATIDHVKLSRRSEKTVQISFDEWNVWYQGADPHPERELWTLGARGLEDVYSVADGVVVGSLLVTLLRHSDRVAAASMAQLVNVIAPIMTAPGGPAWRQTTFFPFATTSRMASGVVLRPRVEVETYATAQHGNVPLVDAVATWDEDAGSASVFLVNRSVDESVTVSIDLGDIPVTRIAEVQSLWDDDVYARNTLEHPERVRLRDDDDVVVHDGVVTITLHPVSWTAIGLA
ncbi:alpha-N-arabinofuranosidase [Myceligenerans pegani]|uniref:non-reducing end alpha-L-arabinofuranosidase n=1 Tax=Myceligenerans pegani TaxID=2776917 RepID=A0ABR9N7J8_9MICO|nr:alpha-N-arabinofuranosidase [Myceligenerans sp. TRM 65318]MBE1879022.1 alpha-N-arabinofuranosidase [Myceligenerans sp. TRM 65318]MBE3021293.1 alpha-N-arabinofuranosidase [Myceligenerans sp. TRM 65318]